MCVCVCVREREGGGEIIPLPSLPSAYFRFPSISSLSLHSGENPQLSACLLHILRVGVVEALPEAGQRVLLEKLMILQRSPDTTPPTAVVALEGGRRFCQPRSHSPFLV